MYVAITNQHSHPVDEESLRQVVMTTLAKEGVGPVEVSLLLGDDPTIAALNEAYRGHAAPTDVLAFPQAEAGGLPAAPWPLLGDVAVSVDAAARQAAAYGWSVDEELALLVLHGVLHLLGYEDEEETERAVMQAAEERHFRAMFGRNVKRENG
jgi:probable rRNA maturation factor